MCRWGFTPLSEAQRGDHKQVETILKLWTARLCIKISFLAESESFKANLISGLAIRSLVKKANNCSATFLVLVNKRK